MGTVSIVLPGYGPSPGLSAATIVTEPATRQARLIAPLVPPLILTALARSPKVRATMIVATVSLRLRPDWLVGFCFRFRACAHPRLAYQLFGDVKFACGSVRRRTKLFGDRLTVPHRHNSSRALSSRGARTVSGPERGDNCHRASNPPSKANRPACAAANPDGARKEPEGQQRRFGI